MSSVGQSQNLHNIIIIIAVLITIISTAILIIVIEHLLHTRHYFKCFHVLIPYHNLYGIIDPHLTNKEIGQGLKICPRLYN